MDEEPQSSSLSTFDRVVKWPGAQLAQNRPQLSRVQLSVICSVIFLSALGVRLLTWQDKHVEIVAGQSSLSGVFLRYQKVARQILDEGRILFPREQPVAGDARLLAHPPGYSLLLAAISGVGADEHKGLWLVQIVCDALAALLIFLIALDLLNWWVGMIAAMLVALSPHLAYYSLFLTPDSLAVPPILLAVYLVITGLKRPRLTAMMLAGGLVGLSCWLTANAMLLSLFLGAAVLLLFERDKRIMHAAILVGSTIAVIAPLTIRNFIVFDRF
ncbi:MAG TPA: glycosyltransferase family 39 protein, partial [Blastocatellia bacterium]|nr:glycosyltransferase family 39 protein [Blastocatellia bacterium]